MSEKTFQRNIIKRLAKCNTLCYKFASPAHAGVPDLICIGPGGVFFIEVKNPNGRGRLSKLQEVTIEKMRKHGATVYVVDSQEKLEEILDAEKIRPEP